MKTDNGIWKYEENKCFIATLFITNPKLMTVDHQEVTFGFLCVLDRASL